MVFINNVSNFNKSNYSIARFTLSYFTLDNIYELHINTLLPSLSLQCVCILFLL